MAKNFLYIAENAAIPDYVKIGSANNVEERLKALSGTNVPFKFQLIVAYEFTDALPLEKLIKDLFGELYRVDNKEFYERKILTHKGFYDLLEKLEGKKIEIESQPEEDAITQEKADEAKNKNNRYNFDKLGIGVGSTLVLSRNEKITCEVVDQNNVSYKGKVMPLSSAAKEALEKVGILWSTVRGSDHWLYDNELLTTRKERIESE